MEDEKLEKITEDLPQTELEITVVKEDIKKFAIT